MKPLSLFFLLCAFATFSQEKIPENFIYSQIINEVQVSGNVTAVAHSNTTNKFGGGIGIYHFFLEPFYFNVGLGLEYNFTSQYCKYIRYPNDPKTSYSDVNVQLHNFTLPFIFRFCVGSKTKALFEFGGYLEFTSAKGFGNYYTWSWVGSSSSKGIEYDLRAGFNGGVQASVGLKIPLNSKLEMPIVLTYRYGFRRFAYDFQNQYLKLSLGLNWAKKYEPSIK